MEFIYTTALATNSSTMQAVYWNKQTQELVIHFWAGSVIKYVNFTEEDFRAFANSLSKGSFYNRYIKGSFHGEKLSNDTMFVHESDRLSAPQELEAVVSAEPIVVNVNIYVNGDPEQIAKAVERLAPSVRAVQNWRG
jgi:hypothetical protein